VDQEVARKVFAVVAGIVMTDNELSPHEDTFLGELIGKLKLPPEARTEIKPVTDGKEAARMLRDLPEMVRGEVLELLLAGAIADGKVVPEERAFLDAVAEAVGCIKDE
jgi:tellurite resistance protein